MGYWKSAMDFVYDGVQSRPKLVDPLGVRTNMTYDRAEDIDRPLVVDARPADASADPSARPAGGPTTP